MIAAESCARPSAVRCWMELRLSMTFFITIGTPRFATFAPIRQVSANATRHLYVVRYGSSERMVCQSLRGPFATGTGSEGELRRMDSRSAEVRAAGPQDAGRCRTSEVSRDGHPSQNAGFPVQFDVSRRRQQRGNNQPDLRQTP